MGWGRMAPGWCLLPTPGDLHSDPRHPCKSQERMRLSVTLALGPEVGWRQVKTGWMARRTKIVSSGLNGRPRLKKKTDRRRPPRLASDLHLPPYPHTYPCVGEERDRETKARDRGTEPKLSFLGRIYDALF